MRRTVKVLGFQSRVPPALKPGFDAFSWREPESHFAKRYGSAGMARFVGVPGLATI